MTQCILNYQINKDKLLGKGGFGNVFLAQNQYYQECACKIISLQTSKNYSSKFRQLIDRELSIMSTLDDSSIVKMLKSYYDGENIYIFMEYCNGGTLKQKLRQLKITFPDSRKYQKQYENLALDVFWSLLDSLTYLYQKNIIHRDIKLENVLIHNGKYKLSDFGLSKFLGDIDQEQMNSILGTPCYQSPQMLKRQTYSPKTDIWSFGVLLFELIKGEQPFVGYNTHDLLKDIEYKISTQHLNNQFLTVQNTFLRFLIKNMLVIDENQRISLKQLIDKSHTYQFKNETLQDKENRAPPQTEYRFKPYKPIPVPKYATPQHVNKYLQTKPKIKQKNKNTFFIRIFQDKVKTNFILFGIGMSFLMLTYLIF